MGKPTDQTWIVEELVPEGTRSEGLRARFDEWRAQRRGESTAPQRWRILRDNGETYEKIRQRDRRVYEESVNLLRSVYALRPDLTLRVRNIGTGDFVMGAVLVTDIIPTPAPRNQRPWIPQRNTRARWPSKK